MRKLFAHAAMLLAMAVTSCIPFIESPDAAPANIEAVDLGLSVKWASFNVGATTPEGYGTHFAWGEVSPKEKYTDATYKYRKEYVNAYGESVYDFVDLGDISGTQYDAASVNWGGNWRMPTISEMEELINDCTWEESKLNGVNGFLVIGTNGNSIFLPAAGYIGGKAVDVGLCGRYWSSTLTERDRYYAYGLYFSGETYSRYNLNRSHGRSVRAVMDYK